MKKIASLIIITLLMISLFSCSGGISYQDIIRIHIRANSNSETDQQVKYLVKDKIVEYITPLSESISGKNEMYALLKANLDILKEIADTVLLENKCGYSSDIYLREEEFPVRTYDDITLPSGIYDALIINLGEGKGDNWWCVAFPPLCFIGAKENGNSYFTYKSKLLELIKG